LFFDGGKDVRGPASMKLPGHDLRGQRYADPAESRGEHHAGDRFTVY
jgi:hypothetical protein